LFLSLKDLPTFQQISDLERYWTIKTLCFMGCWSSFLFS